MTSESHLHWSFRDEHVLLPTLILNSFGSFFVACILVTAICVLERFFTFVLQTQWVPRLVARSRITLALWRTGLYSVATSFRLCYMLVAMTFHIGLITVIVISLSTAQFVVEVKSLPRMRQAMPSNMHEASSQPLLSEDRHDYPLKSVNGRPRSRSKPEDIFIHPAESNIARADAVALELGLAGETERVQAFSYPRDEPAWETGKGRDMAREMLLGSHKKQPSQESFYIHNGSDSDSFG
ncbi:hypothetical protein GALMADRAFT_234685 [Galerina marginata CBS 339.88]|uniref:Copper transporter n=1 Tax=Galerina marginata (strain CBS 339.88) TaxID=685588 RepID=A0A067U2Q2_GALM3|nr:hypothetical protein GALMADRAFT_234685 [Galerina marginata CBS 339.88]